MSTATATQTKTYTIDPAHSTVRFWARHLMIAKVHGEIDDVTGTIQFDPANPEASQVEATIGLASLSTRQEQRDAHLKSADFLDVEQFPTITFKSTSVRAKGGNEFEAVGDLTIRGITREVTLEVELSDEAKSPFGGYKIGATAKTVINREDFGILWNQALETGGVMVGKEIHIEIDAELDRPE
jgi:polyisoprenoid-binding protein YceI